MFSDIAINFNILENLTWYFIKSLFVSFGCKISIFRNYVPNYFVILENIAILALYYRIYTQIVLQKDIEIENYSCSVMVDSIDIQILRELQKNARLTVKELAAKVSLSTTPVFERVKRLEKEGVIRRYIAVLDSEKLNKGFVVFCSVR